MKKLSVKLKALRLKYSGKANCPKGCYKCCTAMKFSDEEYKRFRNAPKLWGKGKDYCEYLDSEGKCSIYEERPMICRAFGKTDSFILRCDHLLNHDNLIPEPPEMRKYNPSAINNNEGGIKFKKLMENPEKAKQFIREVIELEREGRLTEREAEAYLSYLKKRC